MTIMDELLQIIQTEELEDILCNGWIDNDEEITRFVPHLSTVYLEFKSVYLKLYRKQTTNFDIKMSLMEKNKLKDEKYTHEVYEEYPFCILSLYNMFIYEGRKEIAEIEMYTESEEKYNNGIVKCIGLQIPNNSYVFFDGLGLDNIEVGKREERDRWFDFFPNMDQNVLVNFNPKDMIYKKCQFTR